MTVVFAKIRNNVCNRLSRHSNRISNSLWGVTSQVQAEITLAQNFERP